MDVVKVSKQDSKITPQWKSESLCTPGCVTGVCKLASFKQ
ncbi:gallidermin/nisin family lantibiotic [Bacillus subtilis]|nr:gallidermin/nisin family lantibiotic [Bacillus subtilis]